MLIGLLSRFDLVASQDPGPTLTGPPFTQPWPSEEPSTLSSPSQEPSWGAFDTFEPTINVCEICQVKKADNLTKGGFLSLYHVKDRVAQATETFASEYKNGLDNAAKSCGKDTECKDVIEKYRKSLRSYQQLVNASLMKMDTLACLQSQNNATNEDTCEIRGCPYPYDPIERCLSLIGKLPDNIKNADLLNQALNASEEYKFNFSKYTDIVPDYRELKQQADVLVDGLEDIKTAGGEIIGKVTNLIGGESVTAILRSICLSPQEFI